MPDLHAVTTLLFDWFRYKSVFISAAFDSLHHLLLYFLHLVSISFHLLFFPTLFCLISDEKPQHAVILT